ncbi:MAG: PaaI family thioesterase [Dehalococcoidia bacterium]|nr:PaaI family thioesterase [Dehalococcoidia bacterium]MCA9852762.1 PaaI family thioesterase [Dehalococcoidia bacterium]MCC6234097.1 PaaI family thioesterase [Verrucomicrobiales bacterium]
MGEELATWVDSVNSVMWPIWQDLGVEFAEATPERLVVRLNRTERTTLPDGYFNGAVLEMLVSVTAGNLPLVPLDGADVATNHAALTTQVNLNFLGNTRDDQVFAEARYLRKGRTQIVVETHVRDRSGKLLVSATTTLVPLTSN